MKKIVLFTLCIAWPLVMKAQVNLNIGSGAYVVASGNPSFVMDTGSMVNNGTYLDSTGSFVASGGITFSGSGVTHFNNFTVNNGQHSVVNSLVSVYDTANLVAGNLNANNYLYIRSDANNIANMMVSGVLTGNVAGIIARASVTSGSGSSYTSNLTLNISGPVMSYQWQSSPDSTTWAILDGATLSAYTATVTATTYYRCNLIATNSGYSEPTPGVRLLLPEADAINGIFGVCTGNTTVLTDVTAGGTWTSNNIAVATVGSTTGIVTGMLPGTSTISYITTDGTATQVVTVNPAPSPITGITSVCAGSTISLTDATGGGTWSSNDISIAIVGSTTGIVTGETVIITSTATITYTSPTGCIATNVITVDPLPTAILGTLSICAGLTTTLSDATTGGTWSSSNIAIAIVGSTTGIVTGIATGTTAISYITSTGCYATTIITVNALPSVYTTGGGGSYCAGGTGVEITLSNSDAGVTYQLYNGSDAVGTPVSGGSAPLDLGTETAAGTYTVLATEGTCTSNMSGSATIVVNTLPNAGTVNGSSSVTVGLNITLTDAVSGGAWSASNGNATASGGVVTGVTAGTVIISYAVTGSCGTAYATKVITVDNSSISGITGNTSICAGDSTILTDATTGGTWSMSNLVATIGSSTGIVTASSMYAGTATVTYTLGGAYATIVVTVNPNPTQIQGVTTECAGTTITLTDATAGGTWSGTGATISGTGTSATLTAGGVGGTATVTYTLGTGCYTTSLNTVKANPTAILGTTTVCVGGVTILSDATTGVISWTSSNNTVASCAGGDITGVGAGSATITYLISTGCSVTTTVTVMPQPSAITGNTGAICPGAMLSLADGSGLWSSSNTTIAAVGSDGTVTGVTGGTATITYEPIGTSGCIAKTTVTINAAPAISGSATVCSTGSTTLSDASAGGTWSSSASGIAIVGSTTGVVSGVSSGTAAITYTTTAGCQVITILTVNAGPSAVSGTLSVCTGSVTTLGDASGGGVWSSSNTAIGTVDGSGDVSGEAAGTTTITYTSGGCYVTAKVTVNALPGVINGSGSLCASSTTSLTDVTAGGAWSISGPATIGSTGIVTGDGSAGTAIVSYILTTGCSVSKVVTINAGPAAISGNSVICAGLAITLTDGAGGGTWSSSNTAIAAVGSGSGTVTGIASGTATISYMSGGCYATTIATVSAAVGTIRGLSSVCQGSTLSLSDATTGGTWSSSNNAIATVGSTGLVAAVVTTVSIPATVTISYTSAAGCAASLTITVSPVPGAISGNLALCAGATTTLSDAVGGGTWSMSSLDASIVGSTGVVTASATYTGTATISYSTGGCAATGILTVNAAPKAIQGATAECPGVTTSLTDATAGGTWSGTGATITGTGTSATLVAGSVGGTATVTYTLGTGCMVTASNTIYAPPAPITGNFNMCVGLVTILSDASPVNTWSSSNTTVATCAGGDITGTGTGTATILFRTSALGNCTVTQAITVNAMPVVGAISGPSSISHTGGAVTLSDGTGGGIWTSSNTAVIALTGSTANPITATAIASSGSAVISYAVTAAGCTTTVTKTIGAATASHPSGGGTATVYAGASVSLADDAVSGIWSSSDNGIATVDGSGLVTGIAPGIASITHAITDDNGAVTTNVTTVAVTAVPASISIVPNPNKGTFTVKGTVGSVTDEAVTLEVTDVLGQVIYKSKVTAPGGRLNETITLNNTLANGMYILNVQSGTENKTFHFVIAE